MGRRLWEHHLRQTRLCTYRSHCPRPGQQHRRHTFWSIYAERKATENKGNVLTLCSLRKTDGLGEGALSFYSARMSFSEKWAPAYKPTPNMVNPCLYMVCPIRSSLCIRRPFIVFIRMVIQLLYSGGFCLSVCIAPRLTDRSH